MTPDAAGHHHGHNDHFPAHLFLGGFFGENINVLTGSIEKGWPAFLVLGVGLSAAYTRVTAIMLSRRKWN